MNKLLASDIKDIKNVSLIDYTLEDGIISIWIKCDTVFGYDEKYIIAKYDVVKCIGNIVNKKEGIKEYTNLKRLYNACIKFVSDFGYEFGLDYSKLENYKKAYVEPIQINEENNCTPVFMTSDWIINEVGCENNEINKSVASAIINYYNITLDFMEYDAIESMKRFINTGVLSFNKEVV